METSQFGFQGGISCKVKKKKISFMVRKLMANPFLQTCESRATALWGLPGKQAFCFSSMLGVRSQGKQRQDICLLVTERDRKELPVQPERLLQFVLYQGKSTAP